jgi:hypothetical protein
VAGVRREIPDPISGNYRVSICEVQGGVVEEHRLIIDRVSAVATK